MVGSSLSTDFRDLSHKSNRKMVAQPEWRTWEAAQAFCADLGRQYSSELTQVEESLLCWQTCFPCVGPAPSGAQGLFAFVKARAHIWVRWLRSGGPESLGLSHLGYVSLSRCPEAQEVSPGCCGQGSTEQPCGGESGRISLALAAATSESSPCTS